MGCSGAYVAPGCLPNCYKLSTSDTCDDCVGVCSQKKETKTTNANENIKVQDNYNCCIVKYLLHLSHMMLLWFVSFENIWLLQLLDAIPIAITIPIQWRKIQRSNKERCKKSLQKLTIQQRKNYRICLRFAASFFYRTCVFRRASVCTSDPRNVLRVTAVLSSRSRKPELELDSSDCICLEVICLSVTIQPTLIQDGSCCYCCRLIFRGGSKSQKVNRFLPNIFWPNRRCCHCLIYFY